jgi:hypothetical protein
MFQLGSIYLEPQNWKDMLLSDLMCRGVERLAGLLGLLVWCMPDSR